MNMTRSIPKTASPAANDPSPDRPESHVRADDPAAADIGWRLGMLRELAEIGMEVARAVRDEVVAQPAPDQPGETDRDRAALVLALSRISRAVRMTLALHAQFTEDHRLLGEQSAAERKQRAATARAEHRAHQLDKVERVINVTLDAKAGKNWQERDRLDDGLRERLKDFDDYALCGDRSIGEIIARICRDLGVTPDWQRWIDADWARDEIATKPPGSPYAAWPAPTPDRRPPAPTRRVAVAATGPP
jgi:hypothetical protein